MAKASPSVLSKSDSNPAITAAAAEIYALINGRPRSPTKDELVAIIAKAVPSPVVAVAVKFQRYKLGKQAVEQEPKFRAEWDALTTEMLAADAKCCAISEAADGYTDAVSAAEDQASEVQERFNDCARRILKEPVRTPADLMLLTEAAYWSLYNAPTGLWARRPKFKKWCGGGAAGPPPKFRVSGP